MPRQKTGTKVLTPDGRWRGRITLPDGSRVWLDPMELGTTAEDADEVIRQASIQAAEGNWDDPGTATCAVGEDETVDQYFERWQHHRHAHGVADTRNEDSRYEHHIHRWIGHLPIASVDDTQIEVLVDDLEDKVRSGALRWKTANNVWNVVTKMFSDAERGRKRALRVRYDNPTSTIHGPDRRLREIRMKTYLYPNEYLRLCSCKLIPIRWCRFYSFQIYTYGRLGEAAGIQCSDVDFQARTITITKQLGRHGASHVGTKEGMMYSIPIEPNLLPMLQVLIREAGGKGPIFRPDKSAGERVGIPRNRAAHNFRQHLLRAGITRPALFPGDPFRKPITVHDLRGTAATWMALRGDPPLVIQHRVGHRNFSTTELYIREAEAIGKGANIGEPFPPIPERLLQSPR